MSRRMRTAGDAVKDLKRDDPYTPITRHTIVTWAKQGLIHSVMIGNRRLISMDSLEDYLLKLRTPDFSKKFGIPPIIWVPGDRSYSQ